MAAKKTTTKKAEKIAELADELIEEEPIEELEEVEELEEGYRPRQSRRRRKKRKNLLPLFVILFLVGLTWYLVSQKNNTDTSTLDKNTPKIQTEGTKSKKETKDKVPPKGLDEKTQEKILSKVKKIIIVPEETPEIIILEAEKLEQIKKTQPFFMLAQGGDSLLVFPKAQRAMIYRPSKNMLVNVGPIIINPPAKELLKKDTKKDIPENTKEKTDN